MTIISTEKLLQRIDDPGVQIIDTRPVDAYNGWQLLSEDHGGHIKGARSLPFRWIAYMDWIEMVKHKEIEPDQELIIYGYEKEQMIKTAEQFKRSGYNRIVLYDRFLSEWSKNKALPMGRLERYRHLVPAGWVHRLFSKKRNQQSGNKEFVIIHVHYRNRDAYLSGHIPGAIDMDTLAVEAPETWNRRSPEELKQVFEQHGITHNTTVILYGKHMFPDKSDPFPGSAAGDIGAIRVAFIMIYAGIRDVRVLNGGFQSWVDEGLEVSYTDEPKRPADNFGAMIPQHPELVVDTPRAREMLRSEDAELVCVRSWPEYTGEVSGYNYIETKGRIPGAIFANCGSDAYHMENYRNFDHTTREYQEIADIWKQSGITPEKHLAFYCGTGWRGSEAWFNAWLMGWPRVSVYDGGWFEWSADPENPIESGLPEEQTGSL